MLSGFLREPHSFFEIDIQGTAAFGSPYVLPDPRPNPLYRYPSTFTRAEAPIRAFFSDVLRCPPGEEKKLLVASKSIPEIVSKCNTSVHNALRYTPCSTGIYTTAADALALGKGVCQDYTHLLIALLRLAGIPARYVAGLIPGEGETHAWAEYHNGEAWAAVDPTHNRLHEDCEGYLKLSHGRDYEDCSVERGVFTGLATQLLTVSVCVTLS